MRAENLVNRFPPWSVATQNNFHNFIYAFGDSRFPTIPLIGRVEKPGIINVFGKLFKPDQFDPNLKPGDRVIFYKR
ncbi:hypothetical protein A2685_03170 [Candidatus Woesebacteria bacterium RIFCSPHIGHO2_01_FULL_37_10]|uniref:Uncharacterized protein n=1 Tax=Candidatus Woesebacteria bacterium RIFCSPHIGHO2_01_FULL_37_10 TaxID=1802489 RepID=A0A1F7XTP1_9BACT|nr:MAG: hypothetical protein A2685_03170 [Candidatus Woesebacteria bacterium RIFCSPHIGHO2_01_FULL_37_10]